MLVPFIKPPCYVIIIDSKFVCCSLAISSSSSQSSASTTTSVDRSSESAEARKGILLQKNQKKKNERCSKPVGNNNEKSLVMASSLLLLHTLHKCFKKKNLSLSFTPRAYGTTNYNNQLIDASPSSFRFLFHRLRCQHYYRPLRDSRFSAKWQHYPRLIPATAYILSTMREFLLVMVDPEMTMHLEV